MTNISINLFAPFLTRYTSPEGLEAMASSIEANIDASFFTPFLFTQALKTHLVYLEQLASDHKAVTDLMQELNEPSSSSMLSQLKTALPMVEESWKKHNARVQECLVNGMEKACLIACKDLSYSRKQTEAKVALPILKGQIVQLNTHLFLEDSQRETLQSSLEQVEQALSSNVQPNKKRTATQACPEIDNDIKRTHSTSIPQRQFPLLNLSNEVLFAILSNLSHKDLLSAAESCTALYQLANDKNLIPKKGLEEHFSSWRTIQKDLFREQYQEAITVYSNLKQGKCRFFEIAKAEDLTTLQEDDYTRSDEIAVLGNLILSHKTSEDNTLEILQKESDGTISRKETPSDLHFVEKIKIVDQFLFAEALKTKENGTPIPCIRIAQQDIHGDLQIIQEFENYTILSNHPCLIKNIQNDNVHLLKANVEGTAFVVTQTLITPEKMKLVNLCTVDDFIFVKYSDAEKKTFAFLEKNSDGLFAQLNPLLDDYFVNSSRPIEELVPYQESLLMMSRDGDFYYWSRTKNRILPFANLDDELYLKGIVGNNFVTYSLNTGKLEILQMVIDENQQPVDLETIYEDPSETACVVKDLLITANDSNLTVSQIQANGELNGLVNIEVSQKKAEASSMRFIDNQLFIYNTDGSILMLDFSP